MRMNLNNGSLSRIWSMSAFAWVAPRQLSRPDFEYKNQRSFNRYGCVDQVEILLVLHAPNLLGRSTHQRISGDDDHAQLLRSVCADDHRLLDVGRLRRAGDERAEGFRPNVDACVGLVQVTYNG